MADTKEIIKCPACGKEMTKVFIDGANISIDICTEGCGGMLFDNRELEKFDEKSENAEEILNKVRGKNFTPVDEKKHRICPVCNSIMVKNGAANGEVMIDLCNVCGAKFLDHGELERIREASDKDYVETPQNKIMFDTLEKNAPKEAIGSFGLFWQQHMKSSSGRQEVENFIRKYV
jgi:Zn-finger nucleic acid-binding protein